MVLLGCWTATHGNGCPFQTRNAGIVTSERRSTVAVDLWRKLTGDETTPSEKLITEATAAHRKLGANTLGIGANNTRTPSPSLRRWLAAPVGAGGAGGFGSNSERLHPGIKVGCFKDTSIDSPAPGAYDPAEIASKSCKGSTWSRISTTKSRLKKEGDEDDEGQRNMPWDERDVTPAMGDYRTSCRNMANEAAKHVGRVSPGMNRASTASRLQHVKTAVQQAGPGSYDVGGFNLSRNLSPKNMRPSAAFASKAVRTSPFGGKPLVANLREM